MIDSMVYECGFSVTTPILTNRMAEEISDYYTNLGYTITDYHNGMLGISW